MKRLRVQTQPTPALISNKQSQNAQSILPVPGAPAHIILISQQFYKIGIIILPSYMAHGRSYNIKSPNKIPQKSFLKLLNTLPHHLDSF